MATCRLQMEKRKRQMVSCRWAKRHGRRSGGVKMWRVKRVIEHEFVFIFFSFLGFSVAGGIRHPTS